MLLLLLVAVWTWRPDHVADGVRGGGRRIRPQAVREEGEDEAPGGLLIAQRPQQTHRLHVSDDTETMTTCLSLYEPVSTMTVKVGAR